MGSGGLSREGQTVDRGHRYGHQAPLHWGLRGAEQSKGPWDEEAGMLMDQPDTR